jgi:serine/threonine protein kinase
VRELLGSGTSGQVFRGVSKETGRDWAVKIVDAKKLALGKDYLSRY